MSPAGLTERPVAVVTGGGGGIGAAIAMELGRRGVHVVTVDPMVSLDGSEHLGPSEHSTARRILDGGGSATESEASVTDRDAVHALFEQLLRERGRVDAVVNAAGITRRTSYASGDEDDWSAVLSVHLDGYLNVLDAALPIMARAGRGHVLGVTSGSGWRAADAGAYSCAKRAVASLTWQLGRAAPPDVHVNAISPIAMTRMVAAALGGAPSDRSGGGARATGGLSLAGMPDPEEIAPLAAHLVGPGVALRGRVLFAGGSEVAAIDPPRLLDAVRTRDVDSLDSVLDRITDTLATAETTQSSTGGANPRFAGLFVPRPSPDTTGLPGEADPPGVVAVVCDRPDLAAGIVAHLDRRAVTSRVLPAGEVAIGFDAARRALATLAGELGRPRAVVVALASSSPSPDGDRWDAVLSSHGGLVDQLRADAAWIRATAGLPIGDGPAGAGAVRLVQVVDAASPGGRSRAQAVAQLSRSSRRSTDEGVAAFTVGMEDRDEVTPVAALVAHLATDAPLGLSGAELVVGSGWLGVRSHPRPATSVVHGGPQVPEWLDEVLSGT